jgi:DNA replication and repair protein RecF
LRLVRGRHQERLRWVDFGIAQVEPPYLQELARFQRCLKLRNAALKQDPSSRELEALDETYVAASRAVCARRREHWPALRSRVLSVYESISSGAEALEARYESDVDERFAERLSAEAFKEREARTTIAGPNRDRVVLELGGLDAADSSSEGQARSLALAFKIAQARFIRDRLGRPPILLIDDVWGELDDARRESLAQLMTESPQVLLTSTDASRRGIPSIAASATAWRVAAGLLEPISKLK